jgi:phosphatidylserine/phosphatidylglycerophosphate/cardiolipin synthase-like enzyme
VIGWLAGWMRRAPVPAQDRGRRRRPAVVLLATALAFSLVSCTGTQAPTTPVPVTPTPTPATVTPSPVPTEQPQQPTQRVVLGDPWSKDPVRVQAVAESALELVNAARKGQRITLSMFNMTYPSAADTLIRAFRRGVEVRVVVNIATAHSKQVRKLRAVLGTRTSARSWVVVRGGGMRMHSKFMLVSRRGTEQPVVVWVSSGNLTNANGRNQANEALITTGDTRLYDFLVEQFDLMRKGITDPARLGRTATTATTIARTFPIPAGGPANDPVEKALKNVMCVHGKDRTIIRLAHLLLTKERVYLTDQLRDLEAAGCDVRVVVHLRGWIKKGRNNLLRPGKGRVALRSAKGTILHTKITTIDGWDAAGARLQIAMVGTHNLTGRALTTVPQGYNDELSITVWNPAIVEIYSAWVDHVIKAHSLPVYRRG